MQQAVVQFSQSLARWVNSRAFQGAVIAVIVLSALSIGAKTYQLPLWLERTLATLDGAITVFFALELTLRFLAHGGRPSFFKNGWNLFDTAIVLVSLVPLSNADTVLLARLLRIFRVLRLVSLVPELRQLINALIKSIPKMGYIALLMFVFFYIYAALGSTLFAELEPRLWQDVSVAMLTLFRVATFDDWNNVMYVTLEAYPLAWIYFISFIFLNAFIFLNMMVGVILDVMTQETEAAEPPTAMDQPATAREAELAQLSQELATLSARLARLQR
ncbi:ion transporter [Ferrimonas balearica]|uniref:ion transporter n=1 Tax=Ferrimonas balearica TaxID=44012 RepID=UPI001C9971C4|nr:ion transporter [Ferrimonas balearica]MBY5993183.1 ion transporter [Ferrimonas balearica]